MQAVLVIKGGHGLSRSQRKPWKLGIRVRQLMLLRARFSLTT